MKLLDLLQLLRETAAKQETKVYIVGGIPRDRLLGLDSRINDVDITTGSDTHFLAKEFSIALRKVEPITVKQGNDGHFSIHLKSGLKFDFSTNFRTPNIKQILYKMGIQNPTNIQEEIYSRDFYINTLLMNTELSKIKDITKQGIKDIENKIIRTCLDPENTFKYNIKRIIRVIYLAAKLDFNVDPQIIQWIKSNPNYLLQCDKEFLSKNINKAISYNPERTIYLINKMDLWKYIPITESLMPYYQRQMKSDILNGL